MKLQNLFVFTLIFLILILFNACGEQKSKWQGFIKDVDGVTYYKNPKVPLNERLSIIFETDLTIGVKEGDENYMFGSRIYVNADEYGNFYITDWDKKTIKKYDPEGKYILSIGRKGQGPGEFQNISVARFSSENNLYVTDIVQRKISFFNKNGGFIDQIKINKQMIVPLYINSKGNILGENIVIEEQPEMLKTYSIIGLFDKEFNLLAEIRKDSSESKPQPKRDTESLAARHAKLISQDAFKPRLTYLLSKSDFIYYGYPKNYRIQIYNPEGLIERIIEKEYEPIEVSKEDITKYLSEQEEFVYKYVPLPENVKRKAFNLAKFPKYKPPYQGFTLMENGWLFVTAGRISEKLILIDIFDQEGKYIAQFKTHIPTESLFFKNEKAYAISVENDYVFVKRYTFQVIE